MTQLISRRLLDDPFKYVFGPDLNQRDFFSPQCEVAESEDKFFVSVDLPGVSKEDISIEVKDSRLSISATRKKDNSDYNSVLSERFYGKYERSFKLSEAIDDEHIEAKFENGVLTISLAKRAKEKARMIKIN